jgi:hypothetical protein
MDEKPLEEWVKSGEARRPAGIVDTRTYARPSGGGVMMDFFFASWPRRLASGLLVYALGLTAIIFWAWKFFPDQPWDTETLIMRLFIPGRSSPSPPCPSAPPAPPAGA